MASFVRAQDRIDEALWLSEALYMATAALDEESDRVAFRTVLDRLQGALEEVKATLAAIAGEREALPPSSSAS